MSAAASREGWKIVESALAGRTPPWLDRFLSRVGRAAHRHGMLREGDRVLVGVSGGKDSIATALALALRRRRVSIRYDIAALMVDWEEFPARGDDLDSLKAFFELAGIPFELRRAAIADWAPTLDFSCYSCARARKRILFEAAREKGFATVAFGHHLDDFAETALMNLCFRASLEPLEPVREFFGGSLRVIRPLCELREASVRSLARRLELPVLDVECPRAGSNLRDRMAPVVADLAKMDKLVRENIYKAWFGRIGRRGGAMEIRNLMEDTVRTLIDELFDNESRQKKLGFCTCDQCRMDVSCYVLNRVKPEYIVSSRGLAYSEKEGLEKVQRRADLISLVKEGWGKVSHAPRMNADHSSGHTLAPLPQGPCYNFPTIMGRVFDGRTFAPLGEGLVRLLENGAEVPMIDPNWMNPFTLAGATAGAYIFWPRPETCASISDSRTPTFEIRVEVPGLERLSHFIELTVDADRESRSDFSLQHVSKIPDLYLFPEGQAEQNG